MQHFKGLRIITNLYCNYQCTFCYQKDKSHKVLPIETLQGALAERNQRFEYCTIMGGESTLLYNIGQYIEIGASVSDQTRLTTHGGALTEAAMGQWKQRGLSGINISIPVVQDGIYQKVTGSRHLIKEVLRRVSAAINVFGAKQVRINVPLCRENMDGYQLENLLYLFLFAFGTKVTLCEDILRTYTVLDKLDKYRLKLVNDTGFGLVMLDYCGKELGCYTHKDNYKGTDLIVSPVGTFVGWDDYCNTIGLHTNH